MAKWDLRLFGIPARYSPFFNNKDKLQHLSCIIYKGVCPCGTDYIGETISNVKIRLHEHESGIDKNPECFKLL